ncbi:hypothetical protein AB0C61_24770 [Streptomyces sp. NPDC048680]|uniref:hypothetical protein n=1 Tax=Streptomyces sp. NPDC048680 TaxID=3155492 RepID=UPI00342D0A01
MSRAIRATRCTAVVTTLAAGVLGALAWAAPAQAAGEVAATQHSTYDFVWPTAPGGTPRTPDDFVWPVAPGHGGGSHTPDDFVRPAPPAAS